MLDLIVDSLVEKEGTMTYVIRTENLSKNYGRQKAVDEVSQGRKGDLVLSVLTA